jgi:hypothetical protein
MTTRDGGETPVAFARAPGAYWSDDESDCRWCRILLGPVPLMGMESASPDGARGRHSERRVDGPRGWLERVRPVMLPLAAITVLAALTLVTIG